MADIVRLHHERIQGSRHAQAVFWFDCALHRVDATTARAARWERQHPTALVGVYDKRISLADLREDLEDFIQRQERQKERSDAT